MTGSIMKATRIIYIGAGQIKVFTLHCPFICTKTINYYRKLPISETDAFHYEGDDSVRYRLTITNYYITDDSDTTLNEFIIYFKGKFPPTKRQFVNIKFADSVLMEWRLK